MTSILLEVKNLRKEFGGVIAVKDCSFNVKENQIIALIGPNGAGKTTMFNMITGYIQPTKGKIIYQEKEITRYAPQKRVKIGFSRTFQQVKIFQNMTILENMLVAMKNNEVPWATIFSPQKVKVQEEENTAKAKELLKMVKLEGKENKLAKNLSYGQQKLLEIVRAVAVECTLLLLDEPAAGVNLTMLKTIKELLLTLKKKGLTILFIEHNMEFVMDIADTVVVMDYGEEIAVGTPKEIRKNKRVIEAYLGT